MDELEHQERQLACSGEEVAQCVLKNWKIWKICILQWFCFHKNLEHLDKLEHQERQLACSGEEVGLSVVARSHRRFR